MAWSDDGSGPDVRWEPYIRVSYPASCEWCFRLTPMIADNVVQTFVVDGVVITLSQH